MIGSMGSVPTVFVIFGGTGDLTYRKLLPALYDLTLQKQINDKDFKIVSIGRRDFTSQSFFEKSWSGIQQYNRLKQDQMSAKDSFESMLSYYKMDYQDETSYQQLRTYLGNLFEGPVRYMFYLAVAPSSFSLITTNLKANGILNDPLEKQLLIEKPFGDNLESAISINQQILAAFDEDEIYRIDHYLAKEMIINIMTIRFGNEVFKSLWNHAQIDNIQITAFETIGVDDRGSYYDKTGATEDMVQSHLLQILSLLLMDRPTSDDPDAIHFQQTQVLKQLSLFNDVKHSYVKGQYITDGTVSNYRDENRVDPNSETDTYAALALRLNHPRFKDIPIYMRTGKRVDKSGTYVAIQFKASTMLNGQQEDPNILIIRIGPDEGIYLKANIKKPGVTDEVQPITMDFCQSCILENRYNTPQAYERLFSRTFEKDHTLFASWEFAKLSWEFIDELQKQASSIDTDPYVSFTPGPTSSDEMLAQQGHQWIDEPVYGQTFAF